MQERTAELTAANQQLKYERYLFDMLMDHLPNSIYFKDAEGRFIRINRAMAAACRLASGEEAIGKTDFDFFTPEDASAAAADEEEIRRTGQLMVDKEEHEQWLDGHTRWVSTTKMPLYNETGQIVGTFGISRDITDRKRIAEALQSAKEAAEAASRAKSTFLANMSHEIRTPMNAIIGMTELALDTPLSPRQREYLTVVEESAESLLAIINDILDFSKIEAGRFSLDSAPFDIREHLGDTMKTLALRADRKGIELVCRVHPEVPDIVVGDANRLRQVIINLVGNAIKFTEVGEVVVDLEHEVLADDKVSLHFKVSDTGIGIPVEKQATVFEAFEQGDGTISRRYGGTGLGLAISSRLVNMMDGRIWVESQLGHGSTFHFDAHFGLAVGESAAAPRQQSTLLRGTKVLVVDDNATNRMILEEMLGNWMLQPTVASGAEEAIALLRQAHDANDPFRLVLTDAHMPAMSGFSLAQRVKDDERLGSTVIMMLTSGDQPGDTARCQEFGIAAYLLKPVKQSELFDAILLSLGLRDSIAEAPPRKGPRIHLRPCAYCWPRTVW